MKKNEAVTGFLFTLPTLLATVVFFVIPFIVSIYLSLTSPIGVTGQAGLRNYLDMIQNATFQLAFRNTFRFIIVAVPLVMGFSLGIAILLHKKLKGTQFFSSVFVFPMVLPVATVVMFFQIIFDTGGTINQMLTWLGLPMVHWMQSPAAFVVLVVLYVWKTCGYNIILSLAALNSIDKSYYEAFSLESKNPLERFRYITLPLISPYLFFILCLSIINTFKSFREAFILGGSHPHTSIYMIQHFITSNIRNLNYPRLSVATILVFLALIVPIYFIFRFRQREEL